MPFTASELPACSLHRISTSNKDSRGRHPFLGSLAYPESSLQKSSQQIDSGEADLVLIPVPSLAYLYAHQDGINSLHPQLRMTPEDIPISVQSDFRDIKSQDHVKRALEFAAANTSLCTRSGNFTSSILMGKVHA
jgi:hypothetical protein